MILMAQVRSRSLLVQESSSKFTPGDEDNESHVHIAVPVAMWVRRLDYITRRYSKPMTTSGF